MVESFRYYIVRMFMLFAVPRSYLSLVLSAALALVPLAEFPAAADSADVQTVQTQCQMTTSKAIKTCDAAFPTAATAASVAGAPVTAAVSVRISNSALCSPALAMISGSI